MELKGSFLHSGNSGDTIASLPTIREFYRKTKIKPILYLRKGVEAFYYEGAIHPVKDESGKNVMLNAHMISMLMPLLRAQSFFEDVREWTDEEIMCDLDQIRETNVGMPGLSINRWYFYVYPDLACDLTEDWLEVPDSEKDFAKNKIVITRTERYTNPNIDYSFLKEYEDDIVFTGTMREYNNFCMSYDLNIKKITINNFLEMAQAIKQSKFHISNQTAAFQLSTGIHHPRILEACVQAPNVIVEGKDAYDFIAQAGLEYYFHKLNGTLGKYLEKIKNTSLNKETAP